MMNLLLVSKLARSARAINAIGNYLAAASRLGHQIAVFGEREAEFPDLGFSLDVGGFDFAIFIVYTPSDFPDLPYLANLLDGMPKSRRVIVDCTGRYNDTVRVEHDFNHLEKIDGHQSWEWIEAFQSIADRILQPTLTPRRMDVGSFLFHAYDPSAVARPFRSAAEAARHWSEGERKYGTAYVGHNWQRWTQLRPFLEKAASVSPPLGTAALVGGDWQRRPDWAVQLGIKGCDVDPELLDKLGVERRDPIPYAEVRDFLGNARFSPIVHRPLFNSLGLVTNRTFETFVADTLPVVMLPRELAQSIYGPDVDRLVPDEDVAARLTDMVRDPEPYWEALLRVRAHLAEHHSYEQRLRELVALLQR